MKKVVLLFIPLLSILACSTKPELREDIAKFISNFTISKAMDTYKEGGYSQVVEDIEGERKAKECIEVEFSYLDSLHPTYSKTTTNYVNDVQTSIEEIRFIEIEDKYYLSTNGELKESSLEECSNLIKEFFYKQTQVDGEYHTQGMYYGDYIKQVAPVLQKYITIDETKELYLFDYLVSEKRGELENIYEQHYRVNKLGMLLENHVNGYSETKSRTTDILVRL